MRAVEVCIVFCLSARVDGDGRVHTADWQACSRNSLNSPRAVEILIPSLVQLDPFSIHLLLDVEILWHMFDDRGKVVVRRTLAELREERPKQLHFGFLRFRHIDESACDEDQHAEYQLRLTPVSNFFSLSVSVQHTRFKSLDTLNNSWASG